MSIEPSLGLWLFSYRSCWFGVEEGASMIVRATCCYSFELLNIVDALVWFDPNRLFGTFLCCFDCRVVIRRWGGRKTLCEVAVSVLLWSGIMTEMRTLLCLNVGLLWFESRCSFTLPFYLCFSCLVALFLPRSFKPVEMSCLRCPDLSRLASML